MSVDVPRFRTCLRFFGGGIALPAMALAVQTTGTVVDPQDLPVPSVRVVVTCAGEASVVRTDDRGRFAFRVPSSD